MRLLEPLVADPRAPLARVHPLALVGSGLIVMLALFLTLDPAAAAVALAGLLAAIPLLGLPPRALAPRVVPLALAAGGIGIFNAAFAGPDVGAATALRLLGIALAGLLALAAVDPTELADALVQHLRVPSRFAVGALAAFRLAPLFAAEWHTIGLARRARGIESDRSLADRIATFPGRTHTLLVGAIRRATELALAMDARGFGSGPCRTIARPRSFERRDAALVLAAAALAAAVTLVPRTAGTW